MVTVLEVLSPSNKKSGDAQEQYLRKQLEFLQAGISLVEIDLLREGDWIVALPVSTLAALASGLLRHFPGRALAEDQGAVAGKRCRRATGLAVIG